MDDLSSEDDKKWFYENDGKRIGPVSNAEMIRLIASSIVTSGRPVWREGMVDWLSIEATELREHLNFSEPPPLSGDQVNNTVVWLLACAPLLGYFLEGIVAIVISEIDGSGEFGAELAMENVQYWYVTLVLNIALAYWDESRLRTAGHDAGRFKGLTWLVPFYLFQRARATNQNLSYFIVWIALFVTVVFFG